MRLAGHLCQSRCQEVKNLISICVCLFLRVYIIFVLFLFIVRLLVEIQPLFLHYITWDFQEYKLMQPQQMV